LRNLGDSEEVKDIEPHLLEMPEKVLEIDESEVPGEKFLTAEERAIKEAEEERQRLLEEQLKGDNYQ